MVTIIISVYGIICAKLMVALLRLMKEQVEDTTKLEICEAQTFETSVP